MERLKPVADTASVGITAAAFAEWLPHVAAVLGIIWWIIRIYETKSVQRWLKGRRSPCVGCKKICSDED